jgi:nucleoside phosphorylase
MNILLLEDNDQKRKKIVDVLTLLNVGAEIVEVKNLLDYTKKISSVQFDLILLDLLVPRSPKDPRIENYCLLLAEATRDPDSRNYRTPTIVLTEFLEESENAFSDLNKVDINVISFDDNREWESALAIKVHAAFPKIKFDFVIICALNKEVSAFESVVDNIGPLKTIRGLLCREVLIGTSKGVIVELPRMGLVASGVITAYAIERFEPRLVCMSGICGGMPKEAKIYDILVSDVCHQHDVGKWTEIGFKSEHYDIQIDSNVRNRLQELKCDLAVNEKIFENILVRKSEYPENMESISPEILLVSTSSGSAVIAESGKTASLGIGNRKLSGFEMEVYSVYEAARLSERQPLFFAAKCVVDDGDKNKGDRFHRLGCLLSARFVACAIRSNIVELY